ncbi:MAG: cell wall-binding repeat-containing protein [Propionibacteriaceae bacterium]
MSKSVTWWRRSGVAGLGLAVALSTAVLGAGVAQAAPSSDDNTVSPVRGAIADSEDNSLGTITYAEDFEGQFFPANSETTVTLTLSDGARFSPDVTPTFTAPTGYIINNQVQDEDQNTTDPASDTYSFKVLAPASPKKAVITVSGLDVDVAAGVNPGTITLTSTPGDTNPALNVLNRVRFGGQDRYETAQKLFNFGVLNDEFDPTNVVLSSGEGYADALSATFLAGQLDTGTLLTRSTFLSPDTRQAIADNKVRKVYLTGGTGAVSAGVENELRNMRVGDRADGTKIQVVRLGGADRYLTNKKINEYTEVGFPAKSDTALLASGRCFADALALGPIAYAENFPIILTPGNTLGSSAAAQLDLRNPDNLVLAGGTASISAAVESNLKKGNYDRVDRFGGADRTSTAAMIADYADRNARFGDDFNSSVVHLANGQGYADALAAGPVAGGAGQVILLTKNSTTLGAGTEDYLGDRTTEQIQTISLIGLTGSLTNQVAKDAANAVGVTPINPGPSAPAAGRAIKS